jgi:ABC-2 type transport system permease protein
MGAIWTVYKKEIRANLVSPVPYVVAVIFTGLAGILFFGVNNFFLMKRASLDGLFDIMPWLMLFLVPAISMRQWSEELRGGTLESLLTLPASSGALVLGKFLASWTLLLVCLVLTFPIWITVASIGDLDSGPVRTGYLGCLLMGGALLAMGMWISSLTRHQIVAFLVTAVVAFGFVMLRLLARSAGEPLGALFEDLSTASRFEAMGRGVVDFRDLLYFLSFMAFFLYLNAEAVENRRYR